MPHVSGEYLPPPQLARQHHQHTPIMLCNWWTRRVLAFEHDQLLAQKRFFSNQLVLAAQQIGSNARDLAIRSRFSPFLYLCFDLLNAICDQLLACVPELTLVQWIILFIALGEELWFCFR